MRGSHCRCCREPCIHTLLERPWHSLQASLQASILEHLFGKPDHASYACIAESGCR
jgi:hypothetical protein